MRSTSQGTRVESQEWEGKGQICHKLQREIRYSTNSRIKLRACMQSACSISSQRGPSLLVVLQTSWVLYVRPQEHPISGVASDDLSGTISPLLGCLRLAGSGKQSTPMKQSVWWWSLHRMYAMRVVTYSAKLGSYVGSWLVTWIHEWMDGQGEGREIFSPTMVLSAFDWRFP